MSWKRKNNTMTRSVRTVLSLLFIGFLVTGSSGMRLCICADGNVALEMGRDGDCANLGDVQGCGEHTGGEMLPVASEDGDGGCVYVPLSTETLLHSGPTKAKIPVRAKGFSLGASHAIHLHRWNHDGICADGSNVRRPAMLPAATLLAQRIVVLRI